MLTVFTPTYNRAYTLSKLYKSLKKQTSQDFEWIIVDDESSDNTEELVNTFDSVGNGIIYHKQKHGGKHRAINWAVNEAHGEYFFIVDSDDCITNDAVESINKWTKEIKDSVDNICGVAGLRVSVNGLVWGGVPEFDGEQYIEAGNLERKHYNLDGDKAEVYSVQVLKEHPFPEFENEYFVTEAVVWDAIAIDGYKLRWYNKPIYICEYLDDGLTKNGANDREGHLKNYFGFACYVKIFIKTRNKEEAFPMFWYFDSISRCLKKNIKTRARAIDMSYYTYFLLLIKSFCYLLKIKIRGIVKGIK